MSKENKTAIGKRLGEVRMVDFKLNQTQMAAFLGYSSQSHYSKVENGFLVPSSEALEKIKEEKYIRPAWIMYGDGDKYISEAEQEVLKREKEQEEAIKQMPGYKERRAKEHFFYDEEGLDLLIDGPDHTPPSVKSDLLDALEEMARSIARLREKVEKM